MAQAKGLLAVAGGKTYTEAAVVAGRKTGDTVAHWVSAFNRDGLAPLAARADAADHIAQDAAAAAHAAAVG